MIWVGGLLGAWRACCKFALQRAPGHNPVFLLTYPCNNVRTTCNLMVVLHKSIIWPMASGGEGGGWGGEPQKSVFFCRSVSFPIVFFMAL